MIIIPFQGMKKSGLSKDLKLSVQLKNVVIKSSTSDFETKYYVKKPTRGDTWVLMTLHQRAEVVSVSSAAA